MSIITNEIPKIGERLSKLDKRLEAYRDPETGHILISPEQAKDELFKSLLSFYRASVSWPTPIVDALVQIAEVKGKRFNFTEAYNNLVDEAKRERKAKEEREFGDGGINIIGPTPPVPEI